jgi:hypothetical protein
LQAERVGDDLVVEAGGNDVLVLEGFYSEPGVSFYPTTDIAAGAGPFSGPTITATSPAVAGSAAGDQVVWTASAETAGAGTASAGGGGGAALGWVGAGAGLLGVAALAGGGGGSGGGESGGGGNPPPPSDTTPPQITSGGTATTLVDNSGAGQVVYTATATDASTVTFSLKPGDDAAAFAIDANSGEVTLAADPDFETKSSYSFTVIARDAAGNTAEQPVSLAITDTTPPQITSDPTGLTVPENVGAGQVVYTVVATDAGGPVTYSLASGQDAAAFAIDASTGAVTFVDEPDFETKSSYTFTVIARDAAGNTAEQAVSLAITDADETPPQITSGDTATAVVENSGAAQVVYTVTAIDASSLTYSLGGADSAAFTIDPNSGDVTLTADPDFETKSSYSFTVIARDPAGNSAEQAVSLAITNADDTAPTITSGATANVNENVPTSTIVYRVTSTDTGDVGSGSTRYSLKDGGDAAAFTINTTTGSVRLRASPDFETKSSYAFTVVATDGAGNAAEKAVTLSVNDLDETGPTITSGSTAQPIDENSGAGQVVYTVTATDQGTITYSLKPGGDAGSFSINGTTGAVTLNANPNHEAKSSYAFTVVATDAAGNDTEKAVTLAVNDLDDTAPAITSGSTANVNENVGAGQVVYTVTSTDNADVTSGSTTYSLKAGGDAAEFTINANSGAVTLTDNPNQETKSSYTFTVVATDAAGNAAERAVTLTINDLDESSPTITSGGTAQPIDEGSGAGQVVYTATSSDGGDISSGSPTYSLGGPDAAEFTINASTGAVTLIADPDFETKPTYNFTVVATDPAGNASEPQNVVLAINFVGPDDDVDPSLTGTSPADNAVDVPVDANIVLTFDEDVVAGPGHIHFRVGLLNNFAIDADDTGQVTINGNQVTIDPTNDLDDGRNYEIEIDDNAFADLAGNFYGGTTIDIETADESEGLVFSAVDGGRTFDDAGLAIDISASDPATSAGIPDLDTLGAANALTSDDRVALIGAADSAAFGETLGVADTAPTLSAASGQEIVFDGEVLASAGAQTSVMGLEHIAPVIVTSQGLA